ncbi:hypothetical protein HK101_008071 [Irineochytrium annulatum]|nr:hypothetical protein HK101_008071 [Irineochytrium annulatum]
MGLVNSYRSSAVPHHHQPHFLPPPHHHPHQQHGNHHSRGENQHPHGYHPYHPPPSSSGHGTSAPGSVSTSTTASSSNSPALPPFKHFKHQALPPPPAFSSPKTLRDATKRKPGSPLSLHHPHIPSPLSAPPSSSANHATASAGAVAAQILQVGSPHHPLGVGAVSSKPYLDPPTGVPVEELELPVPSGLMLRAKAWGIPVARDQTLAVRASSCVLALHGWLDNANTWDLVAPRLASLGAYVVCIDMAGHGHSEHRHPQGGYYLWDMYLTLPKVDDILGVVDFLDWPVFTLIGHSTGGHIAASFAGVYPTRVRALAMIESIGTSIQFKAEEPAEMAGFIQKRRDLNRNGGRTRVYESFEAAVQARTQGFTRVSADAARLLCERGMEPYVPERDRSESKTPPPSAITHALAADGPVVPKTEITSPTSSTPTASAKPTSNGDIHEDPSPRPSPPPPTAPTTRCLWRTDPRATLWAYLHCPEPTLLSLFSRIASPVLVIAASSSEIFSLDGHKWKSRLAALRKLRKQALIGFHHLHLERESAEGVVGTLVDFLGWEGEADVKVEGEDGVATTPAARGAGQIRMGPEMGGPVERLEIASEPDAPGSAKALSPRASPGQVNGNAVKIGGIMGFGRGAAESAAAAVAAICMVATASSGNANGTGKGVKRSYSDPEEAEARRVTEGKATML